MHVEEVDARTAPDEVLCRFHELEVACHAELRPGQPVPGREEGIAFHRHQSGTATTSHWLADGGAAVLWVHGPRAAFCLLLVEPRRRRQGIGTALLAPMLERCRELGVEALRGEHATPDGAAFAAAVGASDEQRVVDSLLDLAAAELPAPTVPAGYRLATWLGRAPDEHLAAYVRSRPAMDDAPSPEEMDYPTRTAEDIRALEESLARREVEMRLSVALDATGEVAAFSELRVSRGSTLGFTDDTGTIVAARGRGLARAVKLESLRRLRDDHPEVVVVTTSNAEENIAMRRLNESLGFRPSLVLTLAALPLTPS